MTAGMGTERMTEDELLQGLLDALRLTGATYVHHRRSDLAITQGTPGLPDILAVVRVAAIDRPRIMARVLLAWELKDRSGQLTPDQWAWQLALAPIKGVDVRLLRPGDYDAALNVIVWHVPPAIAFGDAEAVDDLLPSRAHL